MAELSVYVSSVHYTVLEASLIEPVVQLDSLVKLCRSSLPGLGSSHPASITSAVFLDLAAHSTGSLPGPGSSHVPSHDCLCCSPGSGNCHIQQFCSVQL